MEAGRHLSMSAFNALAAVRRYLVTYPEVEPTSAATSIQRNDADFSGSDFDAALSLHSLLPADLVFREFQPDLRMAIKLVIFHHRPWWIQAAPYGRERLVSAIGREVGEGRDELQSLRAAGLFDEFPSTDVVAWWDELGHLVRLEKEQQLLQQGREGERLTLAHERSRLRKLGIRLEPKWISIEDNLAGYDILSFDTGPVAPVHRLIEVKSSSRDIPHIFISRNEWEAALRYGDRYVFHVWHLPTQILIERTVAEIQLNIPIDQGSGRWTDVEIVLS